MMNIQTSTIKKVIVLFIGILLVLFTLNLTANAQSSADIACEGISAAGADCGTGETEVTNTIKTVIGILLFVIGIAAVIGITIGAVRFTVSAGDQQAVASARNTIIYSVIGLIVAAMAYAIVNYVYKQIDGSGGTGNSQIDTSIPEGG
jgi:ABC-type Fe3+ transport system permease subunit